MKGLRGTGLRVPSTDSFTPFGIGASRQVVGPLGVTITRCGCEVAEAFFWDKQWN